MYYATDDWPAAVPMAALIDVIHCCDALTLLKALPDCAIDCVVTSPPYYGLRDYGTATWEGGDPDCKHKVGNQVSDNKAQGAIVAGVRPGVDASRCKLCGAVWVDQQIGLEDAPQAYITRLVAVFREVRRVLKDSGSAWLNLGDSYANDAKWGGSTGGKHVDELHGNTSVGRSKQHTGYQPKSLMLIPHRVAIALQDDGWIVRNDIVWHKPNPMPESVKDRCTRAHEYVFHLAKSQRYYYDWQSVADEAKDESIARLERGVSDHHKNVDGAPGQVPHSIHQPRQNVKQDDLGKRQYTGFNGRYAGAKLSNKRSVWTITTKPYKEAHFATFPPELPKTCIKAGCPPGGIVLDPFMGAGTTGLVAKGLGRHYIGSELNPEYVQIARLRIDGTGVDRLNAKEQEPLNELPLFDLMAEAAGSDKDNSQG